jgi:hypothetical protein
MKKLILIMFTFMSSGCTIISSGTWTYKSFGFQKSISSLTVSTNGTIKVEGYSSKDTQIFEGISRGIASGLMNASK